jgi:hypothetical protein
MNTTKYIPLEDMDFIWKIEQVEKVIECYRDKMHIRHIAKYVRRPIDEVAVLLMDLGRKGVI